jgi:hypothetical protein
VTVKFIEKELLQMQSRLLINLTGVNQERTDLG